MTKYLLAFDTSSEDVILNIASFAYDQRKLLNVCAKSIKAPRAANTTLLPAIDEALNHAGIKRYELAAVAVGVTLGSYTGVRIGIATAKGIAQGLDIPLYGLAIDPEKLSPDHLLNCFMRDWAHQNGDPSSVLPRYTMLSYAEEAEKDQHPQRYGEERAKLANCAHYYSSDGTVLSNWPGERLGHPEDLIIPDDSSLASGTSRADSQVIDGCDDKTELLLGIETSCDETAAAVICNRQLLSNVVASQAKFHARFGGVVPEIASRKHSEAIVTVVDAAIDDAGVNLGQLTGIAVTDRPGLIGALVVGQAYAKGLAWALQIPLYGINHLEGHLYACAIDDGEGEGLDDLPTPLLALIVSGGHTALVYSRAPHHYETLGETLDDAAGEAFDKVAKVLGLGYPGGPILSKLAQQGNPRAIDFPRAMLHSKDYAFSLSGLKTAVITYIRTSQQAGEELHIPDIAASFQQAVVDVQVAKAVRAAKEKRVKDFVMAGGVAANQVLRQSLVSEMKDIGVTTHIPPFKYCGDNAAMIARTATARLEAGQLAPLPLDADCCSAAALDN